MSGKLASRPQWDACLEYLREGDTLVAVKLDRIGRSLINLASVVADLEERRMTSWSRTSDRHVDPGGEADVPRVGLLWPSTSGR